MCPGSESLIKVLMMSVPSRYESVLVLQHPVEEDSGTYKIVASAGKIESKEFSFKLFVTGNILSFPALIDVMIPL